MAVGDLPLGFSFDSPSRYFVPHDESAKIKRQKCQGVISRKSLASLKDLKDNDLCTDSYSISYDKIIKLNAFKQFPIIVYYLVIIIYCE